MLKKYRDANGVLFYDVGVRRYDGAGPFARGLSLGSPSRVSTDFETAKVVVPLTNTGEAGTGVFDSDIYRLSASVSGDGWSVSLPYEVVSAKAGQTIDVSAIASHVRRQRRLGSRDADGDERDRPDEDADRVVHGLHRRGLGRSGEEPGREHAAAEQHREPVPERRSTTSPRSSPTATLTRPASTVDLFVSRVEAREGRRPGVTEAQADQLRTAAEAIRRALAC